MGQLKKENKMPQKLVVGPFNRGLRNDVTAFNVDNDSFPTLVNAYQWRGRVKRKRGTSLLGILTRFFNVTSTYGSIASINLVAGSANIFTGFGLETNANLIPGNVTIADISRGEVFTDPAKNGILVGNLGGSGTIIYSTGIVTIAGGGADAISITIVYYPSLPVMGLRDLILNSTQYPGTIGFDTTYSYNITTTDPATIYDVSFYKNPAADGTNLPGYTPKTAWTKTDWNGQDYRQFWTVNYQGAFWATNGIEVPFTGASIGMQFKNITTVTVTSATTAILAIANHGLVIGDFLFINEVLTTTGINFQTGYVTAIVPNVSVTVTFPFATITTNGSGGIAQYLTNRSNPNVDCLRWYDGDPTNGNATSPTFVQGKGWVNFAPPLSNLSFSISDLPAAQYYLVGARIIIPFKDRLCFFGPVVQTSTGNPIYLQDTVIYSQNGTPFYTASYTNSPNSLVDNPMSPTNVFHPILVPTNQTATPSAYFEDSTGFGGFQTVGLQQPILTVSRNQDVLIIGFSTTQAKMVFTGNDVIPFNFYLTNSELGSGSTFSAITLDQGVMTRGNRGYIISNQVGTERIDLEIPDEVFEIKLDNNGSERVTAQRDFINEWIYFTYPLSDINYVYPTQTLQYNYRDNSWAIFNETYTTYGQFKVSTGLTWATVGNKYPSWSSWNDPWDAGTSTTLQPKVIAGNQQGFVLFREEGTDESNSLIIQSMSGSTITCINHCLNTGDYIVISGIIGTSGYQLNGRIFSVGITSTNTFTLNPAITITGTYFGGGMIQRMYVPFIQTKQFPAAWDMGRKTRIGVQQYLFSTTEIGQIQLLIFLNQNASSSYNFGPIVPIFGSLNNSLIYSTTLYTCPESDNLGLTAANTNLQMPTAEQQSQIWHRLNTSLIGDTIQLRFTMSDDQMRTLSPGNSFSITGVTQANPAVLTTTGAFAIGSLIQITGIVGMTQLNGNTYVVLSSSSTTTTIGVDSSAFDSYVSGGTATFVNPEIQFDEIELHGFTMELNPSQVLA